MKFTAEIVAADNGRIILRGLLPSLIQGTEHNSRLAFKAGAADIEDKAWTKLSQINWDRFVRDNRVVRVGIGRRSGVLHAVSDLAKPQDLILVNNQGVVSAFAGLEVKGRMITLEELWSPAFEAGAHPRIWVLESNRWWARPSDELPTMLCKLALPPNTSHPASADDYPLIIML